MQSSWRILHASTSRRNTVNYRISNSRALFKATLIILTPKGKARYPAFQMHRKHITALSPTQTYTPKRTRTPLIHIRCILPRFPSWHLNELPLECRCERNLRLTSSELPVLRVNQNSIRWYYRNTLGINCLKVAQGVIQNCRTVREAALSAYTPADNSNQTTQAEKHKSSRKTHSVFRDDFSLSISSGLSTSDIANIESTIHRLDFEFSSVNIEEELANCRDIQSNRLSILSCSEIVSLQKL